MRELGELPSNSNKSKNLNTGIEDEIKKTQEIESRGKITRGVGVKKEKGMLETVIKDYIQQDVGGAINNVITNVFWSGIKNLAFNMVVETARQLLSDKNYQQPLYSNQFYRNYQPYNSVPYQQSSKPGGVNYANPASNGNRGVNTVGGNTDGDTRLIRAFDSKDFEFRDEGGIPTARADAEKTLAYLREDIKTVGYATVASFLRNGGFSQYSHYGYRNIGWKNLDSAKVVPTLTGFIIVMPEPISVRNK